MKKKSNMWEVRIMQWLYRNFEYLISSAAFTVMVGIISLNVGMRYFANYSMPFAEEISYFGFDYVVFFGATMLYRMHGFDCGHSDC